MFTYKEQKKKSSIIMQILNDFSSLLLSHGDSNLDRQNQKL